MLHAFESARAHRSAHRAVGGWSVSVVAHATAIGLAIIVTSTPRAAPRRAVTTGVEHVLFTGITPSEPIHLASSAGTAAKRARRIVPRVRRFAHVTTAPRLTDAELEFIVAKLASTIDEIQFDLAKFPEADLAARASEGLEFDRTLVGDLTSAPKTVERLANGAYEESSVEKVVAPRGSNPRPRYPSSLQADNVEGSFVVRFVVDSTGRVDRGSFVFPTQVHRLFIKSVRDAIVRSRYIPAELAGRRVAQLVQQRFSFVMDRR